MKSGISPTAVGVAGLVCASLLPSSANAADKASITGLSDIGFGQINVFVDQASSQNVCAYSGSKTGNYSVLAQGDGAGGSFTLSSGTSQLPYEVMWSDVPGQTSGTSLESGVISSSFNSQEKNPNCNKAPNASASMIVLIRAGMLNAAMAGDYSGSLIITLAPE